MNPYAGLIKYGFIALIVIGLLIVTYHDGYTHGAKSVQILWDKDVKEQTVINNNVASETIQKLQKAQDINFNNIKEYEGKLNAIKAYYSKHPVLLSNRVCNAATKNNSTNASKVSVSAVQSDDATKNDIPIAAIDVNNINWNDVAQDCAETTQQLISLQDWLNAETINFNAESK